MDKRKRKDKARICKVEERLGGIKKKRLAESESEWSAEKVEWKSEDNSESSMERGSGRKRRVKSEVRRVSPVKMRRVNRRERERGGNDVVERYRSKVLMLKKGKSWNEEWGMLEWLQMEMGDDIEVVVESTKDPVVYKVWCEGKETKAKIWEAQRKWEEEEVVAVEEWRSIAERKARSKALEEIREWQESRVQ